MAFVVLLKDGRLSVVECTGVEVFDAANQLAAGICGVFEDSVGALQLVSRLEGEQRRLWDAPSRHSAL